MVGRAGNCSAFCAGRRKAPLWGPACLPRLLGRPGRRRRGRARRCRPPRWGRSRGRGPRVLRARWPHRRSRAPRL
eukprot:7625868-Alexandrium_andersonii.AAC.1